MWYTDLAMAKKTVLSRLYQPLHPVLSIILVGLVVIAGISALVIRSNQSQRTLPGTHIPEVDIFLINGSGKSGIGTEHGKPVPPIYFDTTITDPIVVQKLYNAMLALPPFPTSINGLPQSCGQGYSMRYYFGFYNKNGKLIQEGTMTINSCGGGETVSLDGSYEREFYDVSNWKPFRTLLLSSLGVSANQLYGAK